MKHLLLSERVTDCGYPNWAIWQIFLKSEWSLSLQGKQLSVANDKIKGFKKKSGILEMFAHHHEFESFPILKDFSHGIGVHSNKSDCASVSKSSM